MYPTNATGPPNPIVRLERVPHELDERIRHDDRVVAVPLDREVATAVVQRTLLRRRPAHREQNLDARGVY